MLHAAKYVQPMTEDHQSQGLRSDVSFGNASPRLTPMPTVPIT
jgi:hypothetical protein